MGKGSAPTPPDPRETAGAQTATNVATAIANSSLSNVNQVTPYGSLTFEQTIDPSYIRSGRAHGLNANRFYLGDDPQGNGFRSREAAERYIRRNNVEDAYRTTTFTDPNSGEVYEIPQYTAVQTLSPDQQTILDNTNQAGIHTSELAANSAQSLLDHMGTELSFDELPEGGSAADIRNRNENLHIVNRRDLQRANGDIANSGSIQGSVPGQSFQTGFGGAGEITRSYGTDFSEDRRRVEEALMSRMNPQLQQDRESLRTSLLNQGIREGSEAYDRAMNRFGEQSNDARMQAILAGGQEQSRMAGLEAQRAGFENSAQQQMFGQLQSRGDFANDARALQFNSDLAGMQAANAAQQQRFGQNATRTQLGNDAAAQNNATRFQQQAFANDVRNNRLQNDLALAARADQDRAIARDETLALRNQPINEIGALLGTGQVTQPSFTQTQMPQIPTTDVAGLTMANYNQQLGAYNSRQAGLGGLLGAGATLLGAPAGSVFGGFFA
jgi:hypothetical protein